MSALRLEPGRGFRFAGCVPGDKSVTHRAYLIATRAQGETLVEGALRARDTDATLQLCRDLGAQVDAHGEVVRIRPPARLAEPAGVLDCQNAGTLLRLALGLLAGAGVFAALTGDDSLRGRPMLRVVEPLRRLGARIEGRRGGDLAPLCVLQAPLEGRDVPLPLPSAQVKSAMLLAALDAAGSTRLTDLRPTRDHTERMLREFGAEVREEPGSLEVPGGQELRSPGRVAVPGDFSHAAFLFAAAALAEGGEALVRDVGLNPGRTGMLAVLRRMGADVEVRPHGGGLEPLGDVRVRRGTLQGVDIEAEEVPALIDELPALAALALCADGTTTVRGASELRVKETDRIRALAELARALGGQLEESPDGFRIAGRPRLPGGVAQSLGDHRIAMAAAVLSLRCAEGVAIEGAEAAAVSFPGFYEVFAASAAATP